LRFHLTQRRKRSKRGKKPRRRRISPLRQACNEFRRPDLYPVLSRAIILNPRLAKSKLAFVVKQRRYRTAACVMLYNYDMKGARRYFQAALKAARNDAARQRLTKILKSLPTVAKIARRSWKIAGKYKKVKKPNIRRRRR
jgi:hypothetical protein